MRSEIKDIADEDLKRVNGGGISIWDVVDVFAPGLGRLGDEVTQASPAGDFSDADVTAVQDGAWETPWWDGGDTTDFGN